MILRRFLGLAWIALLLAGRCAGQTPAAADPLAPIAWMAGDWEAEAKPGTPNSATIQVVNHYQTILNGRALSMETTFNGAERYRGMIGYDPARKAVTFWYLMTTGESTSGTVTPMDGYAMFDFMVTSAAGKSTHAQVHITRLDADHYRWEFFADPRGAGMAKLFDIRYRRLK